MTGATDRDRFVPLAFAWADLLLEVDHQLTIVFAAGATEVFLGRKPAELQGTPIRELVAPADGPVIIQAVKAAGRKRRIECPQVRLRKPQGGLLPMTLAGYCLDPVQGNYYLALRMMTPAPPGELPTHGEQPGGLYDANTFAAVAAQRLKELEEAGEQAEMSLVSMPDLDALSQRLGPLERGRLLDEVGETLRAGSVGGNAAAEIGGGRYSLIHAVGADLSSLVRRVEEIARDLDPAGKGVAAVTTTLTMGDMEAVSEEDLAKGLMYAMNRFREDQGAEFSLRNLSASMADLVDRAARDVTDFKHVVAQAQFDIALQPIVAITTGEVHHFEALCRFHASAGESPYRHITFAEETGLIPEFDLAIARKAIEWLGKYPRNSSKYRLAVNVSGHSIGEPNFVEALHRLLKENIWTQDKLLFEITESSRMSDLDAANDFIQGLRRWGYEVCLDDFGAGAASFQYLSTLEVDVVKLDGSAVRNAQRASKGRAFLSALTELCRRLGVHTIAEMVDSPESLAFVRECGCDYVQGYLFGKPSKVIKDFEPLPNLGLFKAGRLR